MGRRLESTFWGVVIGLGIALLAASLLVLTLYVLELMGVSLWPGRR